MEEREGGGTGHTRENNVWVGLLQLPRQFAVMTLSYGSQLSRLPPSVHDELCWVNKKSSGGNAPVRSAAAAAALLTN